jgi:dUTPase
MASIEDIKKLLESKSFTSARDLDELEEKPDDKQNEVRLNCDPMVGMMEKEGKIFLNSVRFSKAWNSLGKDIPIKQGNAFPLGQGDVLDIDTGVWASFPDNTIGVLMMLPSFTGDTGLTLVGSPFVSSNNGNIMIRVTNVRKDMVIVEKDKHIAELIIAIQTYNQRPIQHQSYLSRYRIYDPSVTVYFLPIYAYVLDRLDSVTKNHTVLILILSQIIYIVGRDLSWSFNSPYTLSPVKYLS